MGAVHYWLNYKITVRRMGQVTGMNGMHFSSARYANGRDTFKSLFDAFNKGLKQGEDPKEYSTNVHVWWTKLLMKAGRIQKYLRRRPEPAKDRQSTLVVEDRAVPQPFSTTQSCATCHLNRKNAAAPSNMPRSKELTDFCVIRAFEIVSPGRTYCKNFNLHNHSRFGAIYSICHSRDCICLPWVDHVAPSPADVTCDICKQANANGIRIEPQDGSVNVCGPNHYYEWWVDYLQRRLQFFKQLGEKAYSEMYDVAPFSSATGPYSNAKAAFSDAISTAIDLERMDEALTLERRLTHIQNVFRSQFK
jgi:hypothetical protein